MGAKHYDGALRAQASSPTRFCLLLAQEMARASDNVSQAGPSQRFDWLRNAQDGRVTRSGALEFYRIVGPLVLVSCRVLRALQALHGAPLSARHVGPAAC